MMAKICLILHNLRSAQNVGALFRVADAVGVSKIYLTGYTPAPLDRFGRPNKEVAKTALGAENYIEWEVSKSISRLINNLKASSYKLFALEQSKKSVDFRKVKIKGPTAVIAGNEIRGVSKSILDRCDLTAEIPMRGRKESLNVAVAASIVLFRWLDR